MTENGTYKLVHRTEVARRFTDPRWKRFSIPCDDYDRDHLVVCYDWCGRGAHTELGGYGVCGLLCIEKLIHHNHLLLRVGRFHVTMKQLSQGPGPETCFECRQHDANVPIRFFNSHEQLHICNFPTEC